MTGGSSANDRDADFWQRSSWMKQLGTNGGGFFGMNSAHPFENPTDVTNFLSCVAMMLFPFSLVLMYGRMLKRIRHSVVIFGVMMALPIGTIGMGGLVDTLKPNPGLAGRSSSQTYQMASSQAAGGKQDVILPAVASLPVDQHLGQFSRVRNIRFGTSGRRDFRSAHRRCN